MTLEIEEQVTVKLKGTRLRGYVRKWFAEREYGFIGVKGMKDERTGREKQWHFHVNSVRFRRRNQIGMGMVVEFTPISFGDDVADKRDMRDKATDVEVVG